MNVTAIVLLVLTVLFTLLYHAAMVDSRRIHGPDRTGLQAVFAMVLMFRWFCLSRILVICVKRGGFGWPASREAQYALVFAAHAVLGVVSLLSGFTRIHPGDLSDALVDALAWVPYVVPAAELAFALSVLFPDALEPASLVPFRLGSLGIAGAVGLAAGLVIGAMIVRDMGESARLTAEYERKEAAKQKVKSEAEEAAFRALTPESPLPDWFEFLDWSHPEAMRAAAREAILKRPELAQDLSQLILSPDPETARKAMYFVGELKPPPAEVGDAVRQRAADVVRVAESIDPNAPDARNELYQRVHVLSTGVTAAAHGLRRAGVDLRPELRAMSQATYAREQAEPRDIASSCARIIAYFDTLDLEGVPGSP